LDGVDEFAESAFHFLGVCAGEDYSEDCVLGVLEVVDFGDGDVVVMMPTVFERTQVFAFVSEVEGISDS